MPPAAKLHHVCPLSNPASGTPHNSAGQTILISRPSTVMIDSHPAVIANDLCLCVDPGNMVMRGSATVMIDGMPAARMGDPTTHGGQIDQGSSSVLIGG
jgi:uncharacterized Zn-binding protein involved in type VI secretion